MNVVDNDPHILSEIAVQGGNQNNNNNGNGGEDQYVTMKKSKKFIKFKDYIIKLPNSMGLTGHRNLIQGNSGVPFV